MRLAAAMKKTLWLTTTSSLAYFALAFAVLADWRSAERWRYVDWFSGTYLGLRLLGTVHSLFVSRGSFGRSI